MKLYEKLKILRSVLHLSQADFANEIGVSRGHVANIERGVVEPTPLFINCVCMMYRIDRRWLMDDSIEDMSYLNNALVHSKKFVETYLKLNRNHQTLLQMHAEELLAMQQAETSAEDGVLS